MLFLPSRNELRTAPGKEASPYLHTPIEDQPQGLLLLGGGSVVSIQYIHT